MLAAVALVKKVRQDEGVREWWGEGRTSPLLEVTST